MFFGKTGKFMFLEGKAVNPLNYSDREENIAIFFGVMGSMMMAETLRKEKMISKKTWKKLKKDFKKFTGEDWG